MKILLGVLCVLLLSAGYAKAAVAAAASAGGRFGGASAAAASSAAPVRVLRANRSRAVAVTRTGVFGRTVSRSRAVSR